MTFTKAAVTKTQLVEIHWYISGCSIFNWLIYWNINPELHYMVLKYPHVQIFMFRRSVRRIWERRSPSICGRRRWPVRAPAPSSASIPPGSGHYRWPRSRSSCWLWGWWCRPADGAPCAGTPPSHWPALVAASRRDRWNSCFELDLRRRWGWGVGQRMIW